MLQKNKSITIVGGGSAGWMAASILVKLFPEKDITLIESPDIPTIGVGESTVFEFNQWVNFLDIDFESFIKYTNATFKYAIGFTDFKNENSETLFYPFGSPNFTNVINGYSDWYVKKAILPETSETDFVNFFFPQAYCLKTNKVVEGSPRELEPFRSDADVSFQFDAAKFGEWLAENYAKPRGVKHIKSTVKTINGDENGIESLVLEDLQVISSDFYIDCTGFKSMLLGEFFKEEFVSTKDILPNNKAWAAIMPYTDKNIEMQNFTNCTGLKNGWVWNIPLWNRIGTGYVYCDDFIDDESALQEFKDYLNSDKMPIPNKNRSDQMQFKKITIKNGYYKRFWVKNVCAIGLAAGFLEPLESTGLFLTHQALIDLCSYLSKGETGQIDRDLFNKKCLRVYRDASYFVALHYKLSKRNDTEYWRHITSQEVSNDMLDYMYYVANHNQQAILAGFGWTPITITDVKMKEFSMKKDLLSVHKNSFENRKNMQKSWQAYIEKCPSHYEYLKNKYYLEEEAE